MKLWYNIPVNPINIMQNNISPLNVHKVIRKLRWNEAERQMGDVTMGWTGNSVAVSKIFDNVYSVSYTFKSSRLGYEIKRTFLVDLVRGVSPVEKIENDYDRDYGKHVIFQDAPYRPFNREKVKWFIFELGRFLKHDKVDSGKEQLADSFLDNFRRNDWEGGFNDYIANSGWLLEKAKAGEPYDTVVYDQPAYTEPQRGIDPIEGILMLLIPGGAAGATVSSMKSKMKTARKQTQAYGYIGEGSASLSVSHDQFLNSTETRQVIRQTQRTGGGGGHMGGTSINSGGFSHHSGKF